MANFHENVLAIAANEENMIKVLFRMGTNLVANGVHGGFYLDEIAELDTAKDVYYEVAPALVSNFIDAFAGAPLPAGVLRPQRRVGSRPPVLKMVSSGRSKC